MTIKLTEIGIRGGVWRGVLTMSNGVVPVLEARHLDQVIPGLSVIGRMEEDGWDVSLPVPVECISDGVQTFLIYDAGTGESLAHFSLLAGEPLAEDIRTEMALLRAELDMLKRAFRRHCLETI